MRRRKRKPNSPVANNYHKALANLMVKASIDVLYKQHLPWLKNKYPKVSLRFRVGSGEATNHKFFADKIYNSEHSITFGALMVASKLNSRDHGASWTTGKEIKDRGYFNGRLSMQSLLVHTILHEYAHFYQSLRDGYTKGSVHNDSFYEILDRLYTSGLAQDVYNWMMQFDIFKNCKFTVDTPIENPTPKNRYRKSQFKPGNVVVFQDSNTKKKLQARVLRLNTKTLTVTAGAAKYRVPFGMVLAKFDS